MKWKITKGSKSPIDDNFPGDGEGPKMTWFSLSMTWEQFGRIVRKLFKRK